jgi:hypothetical protein
MTIHTICDTCGFEYEGPGLSLGGSVYCCAGCASGGPCTCGGTGILPADTVTTLVTGGDTAVVSEGGAVVVPGDTVTIVR